VSVSLDTLLRGLPQGPEVPAGIVAALAAHRDRVLVVLDDDPTGTQSVADLPVLTTWAPRSLEWALRQGKPAVYVMTNSRSLRPPQVVTKRPCEQGLFFASYRRECVEVVID